jgi:hypothetical protein
MGDCVNDCEIYVTYGLLPNHTFEEQISNPPLEYLFQMDGRKKYSLVPSVTFINHRPL